MQHAVKLALVDPSTLKNAERRHLEYRDVAKEPARLAKADLSIELGQIIREQSIPDDVKLKLYNHALHRFLNIDQADPSADNVGNINWSISPAPAPAPPPAAAAVKKKKRKVLIATPPPSPEAETLWDSTRKSSRKKRNSRQWVNWEQSK